MKDSVLGNKEEFSENLAEAVGKDSKNCKFPLVYGILLHSHNIKFL